VSNPGFRYEKLKAERAEASLQENAEMASLMEKLHRFIYDDICDVVDNVMVQQQLFTSTSCYDVSHTRCPEKVRDHGAETMFSGKLAHRNISTRFVR